MLTRKSTAVWQGDGPHGKGTLDTQSGALKGQPYSAQTRFVSEDGKAGTNPEELIAAAHAGCFAMAVSFGLTGAGKPPTELTVSATVSLDKAESGWFIKMIALDLQGKVPGITDAQFQEVAQAAKKGCPVSRALAATEITLNARLLS
jgi:osmotically inducible protein OsmC